MKFICKKCGSTDYKIIEKSNGNGIATGLYCAKCGQWQKWLNKQEKVLFADGIKDNSIADKDEEIARLKAENAELKARLEKAVELPCKVGDKVYCIHGMSNPEMLEWQVNEIRITDYNYMLQLGRAGTKDYRNEASQFYGKWWFVTRETAEARLAELKGEKK